MIKAPNSRRLLDMAIDRLATRKSLGPVRLRRSTIIKGDGWDDLYRAAREELSVFASADEAVSWVNEFIAKITVSRVL